MNLKIKLAEGAICPLKQTINASGLDLHALEGGLIYPGGRQLVPTGVYVEIPSGYEGQVRPRSGLAHKHGVTVLNSPGTIDSDYRGEIKVNLINHGKEPFHFEQGDRIAQLVICPVADVTTISVMDELSLTKRGEGGHGSTGKN